MKCHFCEMPSEGLKVSRHGGVARTFAWCGTCRAETCWDCGKIEKFLWAPIRGDSDYKICDACSHPTATADVG